MKSLLIILFGVFSITVSAQDTIYKPQNDWLEPPEPQYSGGMAGLSKFMQKNLKYPDSARELDIQGKVIVSFSIKMDGSISDIGIKKGVSKDIDKEAMRVTKLLHFLPKEPSDTLIRYYNISIMFSLPSDTIIQSQNTYKPTK